MHNKVIKTFKNMIIDIIIYRDGFELRNIYNQPIFVAAGEKTPDERKTLNTGESAMFNCKGFKKINLEIRTLDNIPLDRLTIKLDNPKKINELLKLKRKDN